MKKVVNISSLINIIESGEIDLLNSFLKISDSNFSYVKNESSLKEEIFQIYSLFKNIVELLSSSQRNGYFIGYVVEKGMREEFDILRFSGSSVINIEIKSQLPEGGYESILDQLLRHSYLLSCLKCNVVTITYLLSENKLYLLKDEELIEIDFHHLVDFIPEDYLLENPLKNINLTDIIISPYTQTNEFVNHKYFLTDEQKKIKNEILRIQIGKIGIIGGPGTGKSMLLFDLGTYYKNISKHVLILFCASLPEASFMSETLGLRIIPIKYLESIVLNDYDVILIDEAQRLFKHQFEKLITINNKLIVFSVDHQQTLHSSEKILNIERTIKSNSDVIKKELKNKIRTDIEISTFILKFFDLKARGLKPENFSKVNVTYFSNNRDAIEFIREMCEKENYVSIELTEYITKSTYSLKRPRIYSGSKSIHAVIGREYDNVLVLLDKHFKYNADGKLVSDYSEYYPYHEDSCIFEALTRVKVNLLLVVIENPYLYKIIQEILTWKDDKLNS